MGVRGELGFGFRFRFGYGLVLGLDCWILLYIVQGET